MEQTTVQLILYKTIAVVASEAYAHELIKSTDVFPKGDDGDDDLGNSRSNCEYDGGVCCF